MKPLWPEPNGYHKPTATKLMGEHIGETNRGYPTSTRKPLPAQGIFIRLCPKCGKTRTVDKALAYKTWECDGEYLELPSAASGVAA